MSRTATVHAVARGMTIVNSAAAACAVILLALIFIVLIAELVSRNLFHHSFAGSWELAAYMMASMFFLGLAPALQMDTHVRVRILSEALSPRLARVLEGVVLVFATIVTAFAALALVELALTSFTRGSKSWELALPLAIPQGMVALGMTLFSLSFLARFVLLALGQDPAQDHDDAVTERAS